MLSTLELKLNAEAMIKVWAYKANSADTDRGAYFYEGRYLEACRRYEEDFGVLNNVDKGERV
tara:strand:- start:309 stop:494 length:186 start_codon:yes stop_codon:yes gene_type:complete